VYCEAEDDDGDEDKNGDAPLHGGLLCCAAVSFSQAILGADQGPREERRVRGLGEGSRVCADETQATMGKWCLVSCLAVPVQKKSELKSERKAPRVPTKSSGSAEPKFAANNLAWSTGSHVARVLGGLAA
jgi:hypothetical protein